MESKEFYEKHGVTEERYKEIAQDANYKSMVYMYEAKHKHDAEKEPEPESELAKLARVMGAPAPGFARNQRENVPQEVKYFRKLRDAGRG